MRVQKALGKSDPKCFTEAGINSISTSSENSNTDNLLVFWGGKLELSLQSYCISQVSVAAAGFPMQQLLKHEAMTFYKVYPQNHQQFHLRVIHVISHPSIQRRLDRHFHRIYLITILTHITHNSYSQAKRSSCPTHHLVLQFAHLQQITA